MEPRRPRIARAVAAVLASAAAVAGAGASPGAPVAVAAPSAGGSTAVDATSLGSRAWGLATTARATATPRRRARAASRPRVVVERRPGSARAHVAPALRAPGRSGTPADPGTTSPSLGTPAASSGTPSTPTAPGGPDGPTTTPDPVAPTAPVSVPAVGVRVDDLPSYLAVLSRTVVPPGPVRIQLQNQGEDPHDLFVTRIGLPLVTAYIPRTDPGRSATTTVDLPAGTYLLACTLTLPINHADAGMKATLTVG